MALTALPQALRTHSPVPSVTAIGGRAGGDREGHRREACQPSPRASRPCTYLSRQWAAVSTQSGDSSVPPQKCIRNLGGQAESLVRISCSVYRKPKAMLSYFC